MLEMKDGNVMVSRGGAAPVQRHISGEFTTQGGADKPGPHKGSAVAAGTQPQVSKSKLQALPASKVSAPSSSPQAPAAPDATRVPTSTPTTTATTKKTTPAANGQDSSFAAQDEVAESVFAQADKAHVSSMPDKSSPAPRPATGRADGSDAVPVRNGTSGTPVLQHHASNSFTVSTRAPATTAAVVVTAAANPLANQPAHPVTFFAHTHGVSSAPRTPLRVTQGNDSSGGKGRAGVAMGAASSAASGNRLSADEEARTSVLWGRRSSARGETLSATSQSSFSCNDGDGQDWLQVPQLFYLFANLIILHEMQLQRRMALGFATIGPAVDQEEGGDEGEGMRAGELVAAPRVPWSAAKEEQLGQLYKRVSFAMREISQSFFRTSLVVWSNPAQRELVRQVTCLWQKERDSELFEQSLLQLLDAISRDESGQVRFTRLYRLWAFLNSSALRVIATVVLTVLVVVCVAGTVLLAVFGRRSMAACIALSVVVGVCCLGHYALAMGCVYHGYRDHLAACFFREEALIAIKASIDKDSDDEFENEMEERLSGGEGNAGRGMFVGMGSHGSRRLQDFDHDNNTNMMHPFANAGNGSLFCAEGGFLCAVDAPATTTIAAASASRLRSSSNNHNNLNINNYSNGASGGNNNAGGAAGRAFNGFATLIPCPPPLPGSASGRPNNNNGNSNNNNNMAAAPPPLSPNRQLEEDRENALLMSGINFRQYQHHIDQHQEKVLRSSIVGAGADGVPIPLPPAPPSAPQAEGTANEDDDADSTGAAATATATTMRTTPPTTKEIFDELREHINVTALMYCDDDTVAAQVALTLWRCNFLVIRAARLEALDAAYHRGSERFKVFLLHAPDLAEGSLALRTALDWVGEKRPVYFFSSDVGAYAVQLPVTACLELPLTEADCNALLLAGLGIDEMNTSMTTPSATPFKVPAYTLGRRLGGGAFGNVFEAQMEKTGARCAVKRMYLRDHDDEGALEETIGDGEGDGDNGASNQLREIAQEVEIMSSLSHPNIVQYMFCERDDNCISIFMELCTGGSLTTMIKNHSLVDPEQVRHILTDVISAVAYLHSKRIVHRDLKPDNVLFRDGKAKVTDFGTAVHKRGNLRMMKGTFAYMAPEIVLGEPYGKSCDVWSIGCIAAEVLSVELPQHALGLPEMSEFYRKMDLNGALEINCDVPQVRHFLLACLQRNPHTRETAAQLLQHEMLHAGSIPLRRWLEKVAERRRSGHRPAMSGGSKLSRRNVSGTGGADDNTDDLFSDENASLQSSKLLVPHAS